MSALPGVQVGSPDTHDAALGQHEHEFDVEAGPDLTDGRGRRDVHDGRLADVLRNDGNPGAAGPRLHRSRRQDGTQGDDHQRGGGAQAVSGRQRAGPPYRWIVREVRRVRDRRRGTRHEVLERPRSRPADDVPVRAAGAGAEPERRAQDRRRSAGDDRSGARRHARGRPDAADPAVHVAERADLAAVRAGAAVRARRTRRSARWRWCWPASVSSA